MIRIAVAACLAALVVVGVAPASSAGGPRVVTFEDGVGEDPGGPDIRSVTVSGTEGDLRIRVDIPTQPVLTEDMRLRAWLDADDDADTGLTVERLRGFDHFLLVDRGELDFGQAGLYRCNGSTCSGGRDAASSLRFSYERGAASFTVAARELGMQGVERFRFRVEAATGIRFNPEDRTYDVSNARWDFAPEQGERWTYEPRLLVVKRFLATPATPAAGKPFALRLAATRTDTGRVLTSGKVTCSLRIAGQRLRPRSRGFSGGRAACVFDIARAARGKSFRSSIVVRVGGAQIARSLSGRIT